MTNTQAVRIAEAAVLVHDARRDLAAIETIGADRQGAREQRRALSAAEQALDAAIDAAVQR